MSIPLTLTYQALYSLLFQLHLAPVAFSLLCICISLLLTLGHIVL